MSNLERSNFQAHPFHLVSPSPWPVYSSVSLLVLTTSGVLTMHGFQSIGYCLIIALFSLILTMSFWFRDIISEGKLKKTIINVSTLYIARAIPKENIYEALLNYLKENNVNSFIYIDKDQFFHYLAGLLEGDGHLSLPEKGTTILSRVVNPRIIFTSHVNNLGLYAYIQSKLDGIGRFQLVGNNTIRYIIGDIKGISLIVNGINGKLRTPKNKRLNDLINYINNKYNINISLSILDYSDLNSNSWFSGFTEADGHFGVKFIESKPKSETRKRSVSVNVSLKFRLDQRSYDKPNKSFMLTIMESIAAFLSCDVKVYTIKPQLTEVLSISIESLHKLSFIIYYFNKYPLIGTKSKDFKLWQDIYNKIINKEHLTEIGRLKIKHIYNLMKQNKK